MGDGIRFGRFEWQPQQRRLLADGIPSALGARAFDLLSMLIEGRDRVLSKSELLAGAWGGRIVEENNLTVQISALRKVLGEGAIVTVPGRGYRWTLLPETGRPAEAAQLRPALAVLPFANLSGDADQEYLADGLAEDLVAALQRSSWLSVIAHSSTLAFRGSTLPPAQICRELGVAYLLKGGLRRAGARLRVTAELIHGASGETAWADRHERPFDDFFSLQDEITARIVATIEPMLLKREEQAAARRAPLDLQHWELLMRARWNYWRSSYRHNEEAKRLLRQALALKPDDPTTLALLAFSLATELWSGWTAEAKATAAEAHRLALRAVALDDRDSFAHFTLGVVLPAFDQIERAIGEQRRALELHPHFAAAAAELGRLLAFSGRSAEAEALTRRAIALSPTEPRMSLWMFGLGIACFVDGRYREAVDHASAAVAQRPDWFFNHYLLAACLSECGEVEAARTALAEGVRIMPRLTVATLRVGHPFVHEEHRERYIAALRRAGWTG